MEILHQKYPKKNQLTEALMDLLCLEREAVYRRLRQNASFHIDEIMKIAKEWNISLNDIIGVQSSQILFKTHLWDYINPSDEELNCMRFLVEESEYTRNFPEVECMEISNRLPRMLTSGFSYLNRFHLFNWMYQYTDEKNLPFSEVAFHEEVARLSSEYYIVSKNLGNVSFIWDNNIFNYLISNICYYRSIYLITDEEKEFIKKDLHALLDYMLKVADKGCWLETGNKVNLYVSHINIDTNYSYYYSNNIKFCCVHAFAKNEIHTADPVMVENFRNWMQSKKRACIQISEADEKSRIEFFMKQRQLIDTL